MEGKANCYLPLSPFSDTLVNMAAGTASVDLAAPARSSSWTEALFPCSTAPKQCTWPKALEAYKGQKESSKCLTF